MIWTKTRLVFASLGLGYLSGELLGLALSHLPYSEARDRLRDLATLPGGWFGGLFYPEGVHTGSGAPQFLVLAYLTNIATYSLVWFLILVWVRRWRRGRRAR